MTIFTYIIGIVLIVQLFNLQIIHGAEYREQSNTRLTRESTLKADRGETFWTDMEIVLLVLVRNLI